MRFLTRLKVGPHTFKIKLKKLNIRKKRVSLKDTHYQSILYGQCNFKAGKIEIEQDSTKSVRTETLIHELFHILIECGNLGRMLTAEEEEAIVQNLAVWMLQVFKDNPKLIEIIQSYDK